MKVMKSFSFLFLYLNFLLLEITLKGIVSQDFQVLTPKTLTKGTTLMHVKDYENMNLIVTKKEIFKGLNPVKVGEFTEEFPQSSSFMTYNSEYILAACTDKGLLSYIKINSLPLEEILLITYSAYNLTETNYECSISYLDPFVYIVHVSENKKINLIQVKMISDGTSLDYEPELSFSYTNVNLVSKENMLLDCEPAKVKSKLQVSFLLCGLLEYHQHEQTKYNPYIQPIIPQNFAEALAYPLLGSNDLIFYKFHKINDTHIRFLSEGFSNVYSALHAARYGAKYETSASIYLSSFTSSENLFYYNNEYIFHASQS